MSAPVTNTKGEPSVKVEESNHTREGDNLEGLEGINKYMAIPENKPEVNESALEDNLTTGKTLVDSDKNNSKEIAESCESPTGTTQGTSTFVAHSENGISDPEIDALASMLDEALGLSPNSPKDTTQEKTPSIFKTPEIEKNSRCKKSVNFDVALNLKPCTPTELVPPEKCVENTTDSEFDSSSKSNHIGEICNKLVSPASPEMDKKVYTAEEMKDMANLDIFMDMVADDARRNGWDTPSPAGKRLAQMFHTKPECAPKQCSKPVSKVPKSSEGTSSFSNTLDHLETKYKKEMLSDKKSGPDLTVKPKLRAVPVIDDPLIASQARSRARRQGDDGVFRPHLPRDKIDRIDYHFWLALDMIFG
ncbi:hypothetical protein EDC01DRAFT_635866 [Geopyxis carbonaria]|nr:hypothetical protein EDC01DRAFT_635866 [Geopyxis carbonaria]